MGPELKRWGRQGPISPSWPQFTCWCFRNMSKNTGVCCWVWPQKWRHHKRVVTISTDEWRMPWACLPRAQVLSTDAPEVAGLAAPQGWEHYGATVCRSPGAAVPACSLWRFPPAASSSPSAGPSSVLQPPKSSRGTPTSSPAADRGWGGPTLPCPGLLGTEWKRHRRPELLQAGGDLAALHPCGCSLVLRVPASLGVPESGFPHDLEPWVPGSAQVPFLNLKVEVL